MSWSVRSRVSKNIGGSSAMATAYSVVLSTAQKQRTALQTQVWLHAELGVVQAHLLKDDQVRLSNGHRSLGPMSYPEALSQLRPIQVGIRRLTVIYDTDLNGTPEFPESEAAIAALIQAAQQECKIDRQAFTLHKRLKNVLKRMEPKMGWREQKLGGWLGGDRDLVRRYHIVTERLDQLRSRLKSAKSHQRNTDKRINEAIARNLARKDQEFRAIRFDLAYLRRYKGEVIPLANTLESMAQKKEPVPTPKLPEMLEHAHGLEVPFFSAFHDSRHLARRLLDRKIRIAKEAHPDLEIGDPQTLAKLKSILETLRAGETVSSEDFSDAHEALSVLRKELRAHIEVLAEQEAELVAAERAALIERVANARPNKAVVSQPPQLRLSQARVG